MATKFLKVFIRGIVMLAFIFMLTGNTLGGTSPARAASGDTIGLVQVQAVLMAVPSGMTEGTCDSWATACDLSYALTNAISGQEIWVAAGTYKPTTGTDRHATFQLKNGVSVYGGFDGTETALSERNPMNNATILSGDLNGDDVGFTNNSENVYHVVTGATGATLDGFTITAGYANGNDPHHSGGGIFNPTDSNPILRNLTISGNKAQGAGGGMNNEFCNPTLMNITFTNNEASLGGGMNNFSSSPTLTNITFSNNRAGYGGGIYNNSGSPTLTNVTFSGNIATAKGGGMENDSYSYPNINNTIFWGNVAESEDAAQFYNDSSTPVVNDSVIQGGCPVGTTCTNIITTDPLLGTLGNNGGFTRTIPVLSGSSAIDTGNDTSCAATDQRGITRPQGAHCDVGAFEAVPTDTTYPTVLSVTPFGGVTSTSRLYFMITFSETVTGVSTDDFVLTTDGDISGATIVSVAGSGDSYSVRVDTGTGDGRLRLDVVDDDSIVDEALNPLGGVGAGNGNFNIEDWTEIDKTAPVVTGSLLADPNPTSAENVRFTVTFSEEVHLVDATDFTLTTTGGITGASVGEISGGGNSYTVNVNTGTGDGTLRLDVVDNDDINTIRDSATNPIGGDGAGNGAFTTGETYTINKSAASAPLVTASLRVDPNPTSADNVNFAVTFSEAVSGVDTGDFLLTTTGDVSGAYIANVSGSGNMYTVTVGTGNGNGDLRLDVADDDSIQNASNTPLGGPGAGNGNFTTGEAYTINKIVSNPPVVTAVILTSSNPTTADVVSFSVSFSEAVFGVDATDFFPSTTGNISGASITGVSGSGAVYSVTVATGNGDGSLRLDVLDDDSIVGTSGLPLGGAGTGNGNFIAGEAYTINKVPVQLMMETVRSNGKNDGWVLESSESSDQGGFKDPNSATFVLGDDDQNRQFRSILHFPTYYLPNDAVITRVLLLIKREALVGTDPFQTHQNIVVDIRSGAFGFIGPFHFRGLQVSDFQSPSSKDAVGMIENNPLNGWYYAWLDSSAFEYINKYGITQIRLRFQIDDDNDMIADYLRFYSGDYDRLPERPQLSIEYYRQ